MIEVSRKESPRRMLQAAPGDEEEEKEDEEQRQGRLRRAINYFSSWQRAADPARGPTAPSPSSATSGPSHPSTCRSRGPVRRARHPRLTKQNNTLADAVTGETI